MRIGVIGLGRLGMPMACLLATKHEVWGYDNDPGILHALAHGSFITTEPDCDYSKVNIASNMEDLTANTDMALLAVNTPTDRNGGMDLSQIRGANHSLNVALLNTSQDISGYEVAICSTTMPGTAEALWEPRRGAIYSNPIWIAMGSVIADLRRPPMMVIGSTPDGNPMRLIEMWQSVADFEARSIILTDATTAEFIKLAHNAWCTTKMSFMSYIKETCPTVDIDQVSNFFRNGGERPGVFWKPGPPFSGPCFPRDLDFFNAFTNMGITLATQKENDFAILRICRKVNEGSKVLILGRAYKYGTDIEENSLSFILAEKLEAGGCEVHVADELPSGFDPEVCIVTQRELNEIPYAIPNCKTIRLWG